MRTETDEKIPWLKTATDVPVPEHLVETLRDCALVKLSLVELYDPGWITTLKGAMPKVPRHMAHAAVADLREQDLVWWATGIYRETGQLGGSGYRTTVAGQTHGAAVAESRWGTDLYDDGLWKRVKKDGRTAAQMLLCRVHDMLGHRGKCRCHPWDWTAADMASDLCIPEAHAKAALETLSDRIGTAERLLLIGTPCPQRDRVRQDAWRLAEHGAPRGTLP